MFGNLLYILFILWFELFDYDLIIDDSPIELPINIGLPNIGLGEPRWWVWGEGQGQAGPGLVSARFARARGGGCWGGRRDSWQIEGVLIDTTQENILYYAHVSCKMYYYSCSYSSKLYLRSIRTKFKLFLQQWTYSLEVIAA